MSEQPGPYGNVPPVPSLVTRVDTLERDLSRITDIQAKNTNAITALISAVDGLRANVDQRLTALERQMVALNESNKLLVDLITARFPAPPTTE